MDALAGLLDGPRARDAFLLKAVFTAPWSIRVEDEAPLSIVVVLRGAATLTGGDVVERLTAGDIVLARGPAPYALADSATTPGDIRVLPGQVCVDPRGHLIAQSMALGVRTWGNCASGETAMLIGTYEHATEISSRVLSRLPHQLVLRGLSSPLVGLLASEISHDAPGQGAVLDRLLDLVLMTSLREAFSTTTDIAPAWYSAGRDPVAGHAIQLMHHHPDHSWTVASLAQACGVSRATLARRFSAVVGEPPMAFLTGWRLALAADLLADPGSTIGSVAARVGYSNAFALSTAFKRMHGVAPSEYRSAGGMQAAGRLGDRA